MQAFLPILLTLLASIIAVEINALKDRGKRLGCAVYVLDHLPNGTTAVGGNGQLDLFAFQNTIVTETATNGFGNPLNKFAWSSALTPDGQFCVGTENNNIRVARTTTLVLQTLTSPSPYLALQDMILRLASGIPLLYSEGGEIWCTKTASGSSVGLKYYDFVRVFKAPAEYVGFRKMIAYKGKIYAGAANGPNGPGLIKRAKTGGLKFSLNDFVYMNSSADYSAYANVPKIRINPYFTNSIQQDIYGPEQTANPRQGAALFQGWPNGTGWSNLVTDTLTTWDRSIRALCVSSFSNRLFVGTESLSTELNGRGSKIMVLDDSGTTPSPTLRIIGRLPTVSAVATCLELEPGKIMLGLWGDPEKRHLAIVDEKNADAITIIDNQQLANFFAFGVMELRVFQQQLYVGLFNNMGRPFTLLRTKDMANLTAATWEVITENGFATQQVEQLGKVVGNNINPWSGAIVGNIYYIGTMAENFLPQSPSRAQLWASSDGFNWTMIEWQAFGQTDLYGFRTMQTDGTRLYIGGASDQAIPVFSEKPYDQLDLIPRKTVPLLEPFPLVRN